MGGVRAVIAADGLGKRYRRQWALADCTLSIPAGNVVGLVGDFAFIEKMALQDSSA